MFERIKKEIMILNKIKKHGIIGSLKIIFWKISNIINMMIFYICRVFPMDNKLLVFESEGDLSDNAFALFAYMDKSGMLNNYKVVWLVNDLKECRKYKFSNTVYVEKYPKTINVKRAYYLATCKWFIYDHCNVFSNLRKRKTCTIINLWHGCGFKAGKGDNTIVKTYPDATLVTGKFFIEIQSKIFGFPKEKFVDLGYPRNDYLFHKRDDLKKKLSKSWKVENINKIFLWMPTFRKSDSQHLSEDYFCSVTGLPLIVSMEKLNRFNDYLCKYNCLCIFKLHHLQAKLDIFQNEYSNIKIIKDEDIKKYGIQLYEILPFTDCLISDYSSVTTDYMLLNKPIIYTLDDYEDYKNSRGFVIENPIEYFQGYTVKTENEFYEAIKDVIKDNDQFKTGRNELMSEMHTYTDGEACERILKYFHIK